MSARFGRNKRRRATEKRKQTLDAICENLKDGAKYKSMVTDAVRLQAAKDAWKERIENNIFNWLRHGAEAFGDWGE